jgi:hypothetical protein
MTDVEKFKAELSCMFAEVGREVGEKLHCLFSAELEMHRQQIALLESLLSSRGCETITNPGDNPAT